MDGQGVRDGSFEVGWGMSVFTLVDGSEAAEPGEDVSQGKWWLEVTGEGGIHD